MPIDCAVTVPDRQFDVSGSRHAAACPDLQLSSSLVQGGDQQPVEETGAVVTNGAAPKAKPLPIKIVQALLPLLLVVLAFAVKMYADAPARSA